MKDNKPRASFKITPELLDDIFSQVKAPIDHPSMFGLPDRESEQVLSLRRMFTEKQYRDLIELADQVRSSAPSIYKAVTILYGAMSIRESEGAHDVVIRMLFEVINVLTQLPAEWKKLEYVTRLRVNAGVQIAADLGALTGDNYYPKMLCKAASDLAPDPRMGNWTAWLTWAEFEIYDDRDKGIASDETCGKVHSILMDVKRRYQAFDIDFNLHSYLINAHHFYEYRNTPLYSELMSDILKRYREKDSD